MMMKIKPLFLCVIPLALVASFAYGNYGSAKTPIYVKDAVASVSSKMSYSFGMSKCLPAAEKDGSWQIQCSPIKGGEPLQFVVYPAEKSPYDVATSFYLIANNDMARKNADRGLLSYLMIDVDKKEHKI
ncbi:MAG: hypothetical protein ACTH8P_10895 [Ewingella sp.]|uniref:hypothetical protein n=1 Tax=Ewingella TaxID=41201 RepID=UPI003365505C